MSENTNTNPVIVYSTPVCPYCHMAKDYFKANGVEFVDKNVATDLEARKEMFDKSHQMGVPVIDVHGTIIVGFDRSELKKLLNLPN